MIKLSQQTELLRFHRYKELEDIIQSVWAHLVSRDVDMGFIYLPNHWESGGLHKRYTRDTLFAVHWDNNPSPLSTHSPSLGGTGRYVASFSYAIMSDMKGNKALNRNAKSMGYQEQEFQPSRCRSVTLDSNSSMNCFPISYNSLPSYPSIRKNTSYSIVGHAVVVDEPHICHVFGRRFVVFLFQSSLRSMQEKTVTSIVPKSIGCLIMIG